MPTSATRARASRPISREAPRLRLSIQNAAGAADIPAASTLRRWLRRALRCDAVLTLRFVGSSEARALNRAYRRRDYPTNVLTFVYGDEALPGAVPNRGGGNAQPTMLAGDIVLCVPVLRREAREQRKPMRAHCAHLVVHGALHLCGYDHETAKDAKVMEALETGVLESLGYDDPYCNIPSERQQKSRAARTRRQ